ncbi:8-oxoguanine DNA glycosylase [Thiomicrorhabdus sp. Kp2]|uniref:8-oxoguanine DNA glycosylase n=1 Tax=Thiomicrorhabdus sp. Kp2 TaxID=1123518 RepID=UPI0003F9FD94|nr:8-oxoguanine DNA glycosylase [Thiomicrorhabdus sp. Kp2]
MQQTVFIKQQNASYLKLDLPFETQEIIPNVSWGSVLEFPSIAYWVYKVIERRTTKTQINYKLGNSLLEETGACLLGGHGIPAEIGLAAFEHIKANKVFNGQNYDREHLTNLLSRPLQLKNGRSVKYRFAKQKAQYLEDAIRKINSSKAPETSGKELRNWLLDIKGIGPKTASWIARNWLNANDVAILDIHILRAGILAGFFPEDLNVEKNYFELEEIFLNVAKAIKIDASELDAVIWYEMQRSKTALQLLNSRKIRQPKKAKRDIEMSFSFTYQSSADPYKVAII